MNKLKACKDYVLKFYRRLFRRSRTVELNCDGLLEQIEDEEIEVNEPENEQKEQNEKKDEDFNSHKIEIVRNITVTEENPTNVGNEGKRVTFCEVRTLYYYEKAGKKEERIISSGCCCNESIDGCMEDCECVQAGIPCVDGCICGIQAQCKGCENNQKAKCYQYHTTRCGNTSKKTNQYHVKQRLEFDHYKLCVLWELKTYENQSFFKESQVKPFIPNDYEFEHVEYFKEDNDLASDSSSDRCSITDGN